MIPRFDSVNDIPPGFRGVASIPVVAGEPNKVIAIKRPWTKRAKYRIRSWIYQKRQRLAGIIAGPDWRFEDDYGEDD